MRLRPSSTAICVACAADTDHHQVATDRPALALPTAPLLERVVVELERVAARGSASTGVRPGVAGCIARRRPWPPPPLRPRPPRRRAALRLGLGGGFARLVRGGVSPICGLRTSARSAASADGRPSFGSLGQLVGRLVG